MIYLTGMCRRSVGYVIEISPSGKELEELPQNDSSAGKKKKKDILCFATKGHYNIAYWPYM